MFPFPYTQIVCEDGNEWQMAVVVVVQVVNVLGELAAEIGELLPWIHKP